MKPTRKVVLITGAVRNSGLAIAEKYAQSGYNVCITSRCETDAKITAERLAAKYGITAKGYGLDLESVEDIQRVFEDVAAIFGRLDIFVGNSANLGVNMNFMDMTQSQFDSVMNVNVRGNLFCCQKAAQIMKEQKEGSIVLIGSVHYRAAIRDRSAYAISKGAVATMVRNLAYELAEYGIRVNQVVAGAIRTDRWDGFTSEEEARRRSNWPLGIESTGEDIANAVYFIASDQAKTITGTELTVDSGVLTCLLKYENPMRVLGK